MIRKLLLATCVSCILLTTFPVGSARGMDAAADRLLLVYDSLGAGTANAGNVETVQRLLASFGATVTAISSEAYMPGSMRDFGKLLLIRNRPDLPFGGAAFESELREYSGDLLQIGPGAFPELQARLQLETRTTSQTSVRLSIAGMEQSLAVHEMTSITQGAGTAYGRYAFSDGEGERPFAIRSGGYAYVPYMESGDVSEWALAYVLRDWLDVGDEAPAYVLFRGITPFSDLKRLERLADDLYAAGIPFAVSVSPLFSNTDYPGAQRYLHTLRFVQSRNGSILVQAPAVAATISQDVTVLKSKLESFLDELIEYGIAPLGMTSELYWAYDNRYREEGMAFFDSVVLYPNERPMYRERTDTYTAFRSSAYAMPVERLQRFERTDRLWEPFPVETAIVFPPFADQNEQDRAVEWLASLWLTFSDYKNASRTVRTQAHTVTSRNGSVWLDGQPVDLSSAGAGVDASFAYTQEETEQNLKGLFTIQNNILIGLIASTLILFFVFLALGYRLYKRKYMISGGRL